MLFCASCSWRDDVSTRAQQDGASPDPLTDVLWPAFHKSAWEVSYKCGARRWEMQHQVRIATTHISQHGDSKAKGQSRGHAPAAVDLQPVVEALERGGDVIRRRKRLSGEGNTAQKEQNMRNSRLSHPSLRLHVGGGCSFGPSGEQRLTCRSRDWRRWWQCLQTTHKVTKSLSHKVTKSQSQITVYSPHKSKGVCVKAGTLLKHSVARAAYLFQYKRTARWP